MSKRIYFKDTQHSNVMEDYANQQLAKVEAFLSNEPTPIILDLTFKPSKLREHHNVELIIKSPNYDVVSSYEYQGTGFYDVLDRVIDTAYHELLKQKERRIDERKQIGRHDEFKKQR